MSVTKKIFLCIDLWHDESEYLFICSNGPAEVNLYSGVIGNEENLLIATLPHYTELTCVDAIECRNSPSIAIAIGAADGSVTIYIYDMKEVSKRFTFKLINPIAFIKLGAEKVLICTGQECALFYYSLDERCGSVGLVSNVVRLNVPLLVLQPATLWQPENDTFSQPTCAQFFNPNENATNKNLSKGFNTEHEEYKINVCDRLLLLLGCEDGTVWCAELPHHKTAMQLGALEDSAVLSLQTHLLESFPSGIKQVSMSCGNVGRCSLSAELLIVEASGCITAFDGIELLTLAGHAPLLRPHPRKNFNSFLDTANNNNCGNVSNSSSISKTNINNSRLQLDADLTTLMFVCNVAVYLSSATGALYASYIEESPSTLPTSSTSAYNNSNNSDDSNNTNNSNNRIGNYASNIITRRLSPQYSPFIDSFGVISPVPFTSNRKKSEGADSGSEEEVLTGALVLHTQGSGVVACEFHCRKESLYKASTLVDILQRACCSGDSGGQEVQSIEKILGHTLFFESNDIIQRMSSDEAIAKLGEEYTNAQYKELSLQEQLKSLDDELHRAIALLSALGDDRKGLEFILRSSSSPSSSCSSSSSSSSSAAAAAADINNSSSSSGFSMEYELWPWSHRAVNEVIGATLRYRFRAEPAHFTSASTPAASLSTLLYLDVEVVADSEVAVRALEGRALLISVHSTAAVSALDPCTHTTSGTLAFYRSCSAHPYTHPYTHSYVYTHAHPSSASHIASITTALPPLNSMCTHRLDISILTEGPHCSSENVRTLLNVILPLPLILDIQRKHIAAHCESDEVFSLSIPNSTEWEGVRESVSESELKKRLPGSWERVSVVQHGNNAVSNNKNSSSSSSRIPNLSITLAQSGTHSSADRGVNAHIGTFNSNSNRTNSNDDPVRVLRVSSCDRSILANFSADIHTEEINKERRRVGARVRGEVQFHETIATTVAADIHYLPTALQQVLNESAHIRSTLNATDDDEGVGEGVENEILDNPNIGDVVWDLFGKLRCIHTSN